MAAANEQGAATVAPTQLYTFNIKTQCVLDDEALYANISAALARHLPVLGQHYEHDGVAVLVGSGPSLARQLDAIKAERARGRPIVAIKDAHDWLIAHGVVPDYAVAIDPQAHRWDCFTYKHKDVKYLIASQCAPQMFDHLEGMQVYLWHLYVRAGQSVPPHGTPLIAGGTTTGLRAITLFYTLGFRQVELYGFDSCLKDGKLRVNGDVSKNETVNEIVVDGQMFYCNPGMTAQAHEFQNLYASMPDIQIAAHGEGLIAAIIATRNKQAHRRISFIHCFGPRAASYRYRAALPATQLGASLNEWNAEVLVIAKPDGIGIANLEEAVAKGKRIVVDICDDHLSDAHYQAVLRLAHAVTCSSEILAAKLRGYGYTATVIDDPYEREEVPPHCAGANLLWFGHALNRYSLERVLPSIAEYPLRVVSNKPGDIAWDQSEMEDEFARADIVIMPSTAFYKSANRTIEAIRQGCFVVAEPHPALADIPGIWIGDIREGIEWTLRNLHQANQQLRQAQAYIAQRYSPRIVACAWSAVIQGLPCTSDQETVSGPAGPISTCTVPPRTSSVT